MASFVLAALFVVSTTLSMRAAWDRCDEMLRGDRYVSDSFELDIATSAVEQPGPEAERASDALLFRVRRREAKGFVEKAISVPLRPFTYVGYVPGSATYVLTLVFRILRPLLCLEPQYDDMTLVLARVG